MSKDLIKYKDINPIITKTSGEFKVMTTEKLNQIAEFMPEIDRATTVFGKQNSQTTASLMTLSMLESGPYRVLRQILAQIEKKRGALKENMYKREKSKLKREGFIQKLEGLTTEDVPDNIKERRLVLEITKMQLTISKLRSKNLVLIRRDTKRCVRIIIFQNSGTRKISKHPRLNTISNLYLGML